jgi:hypothetical protein
MEAATKKANRRDFKCLGDKHRNQSLTNSFTNFQNWLWLVQQILLLLLAIHANCFNSIHERPLYNNCSAQDDLLNLFI